MKRTTIPAAAFMRPSITRPLSHPGLRFMTAGPEGGEGAAGGAPAPTGDPAGDSAPAGDPAPNPGENPPAPRAPDPAPADNIESLPDWAQNEIKNLRAENAKDRTSAKEKAAQEARAALTQDLGKALGIIKDEDGKSEQLDADALTAQVTESQAKAAESARELAVYKAARGANADPDKLLDSRSFLASIKDVDPTDQAAVKAAVEDAVKANTSFALGRVSGASTADTASGPGGGSTPKAEVSLEDAVAAHYSR